MDTIILTSIKLCSPYGYRVARSLQPISRPPIVVIEPFLKLATDRHRLDILRAVLNGFPCEVDVDFGVLPTHIVDPLG
jgi:hypothetical protein